MSIYIEREGGREGERDRFWEGHHRNKKYVKASDKILTILIFLSILVFDIIYSILSTWLVLLMYSIKNKKPHIKENILQRKS